MLFSPSLNKGEGRAMAHLIDVPLVKPKWGFSEVVSLLAGVRLVPLHFKHFIIMPALPLCVYVYAIRCFAWLMQANFHC